MVLKEKINTLMQVLNIDSEELAVHSGLNASYIRSMRKGTTVPVEQSRKLQRLAVGFATIAAGEDQKQHALLTCGYGEGFTDLSINNVVHNWLYAADSHLLARRKRDLTANVALEKN